MDSIHEHGFWLDQSKEGHYFDEKLAHELLSIFANSKVVDMGCGTGQYVKFFEEHKICCDGFDGNPLTQLWNPKCKVIDFSQKVDIGVYDWVLSLEVGEHIPKQYEETFIRNLHESNRHGIVLSWAIPNQPGRGHFNCQSNSYIKNKMTELGYINDVSLEGKLRGICTLPWFRNTLMIFEKLS